MNTSPRPTVRHIAELAGVSATAVSLALRNHPSISEATRKKIKAIAERIGYRPDPMLARLAAYRHGLKSTAVPVSIAYLINWPSYDLLHREAFFRSYFNSVYVVTMVVVGTVMSVALVAFAFSRLEWKGRGVVFALMMSTLLLPYQATLVPQYVLFHELKWIRTFNPITLPGFFAGGAALVFLMRQFMLGIPKELDEAAMIDGANPLQIWWYVIMPLCRPVLATISVFLFVGQWNNLVQPLIYLQRAELYTMPVFVAQLNNSQESPLPWQDIMSASVLFIIPVLVIFIFAQRYFIESVTLTGTKG